MKERKSTLARLLATENITVTQGNIKTAYFDVKNRVLALPNWKERTPAVTDMLIGHEVGHALYTPVSAVEDFREACPNAPFDVCNVVEDIRIERLVQDKYPGLPRLFKEAYSELVEHDFFKIGDKNVADLKFIDRLNLRGKIGNLVSIPLNAEEELIFQKCVAAESFEEVLEICKEICKAKDETPEPESDENEETPEPTGEDFGDSDEGQESDNGESDESDEGETEADESDDGEESFSNEADADESDESDTEASSEDIESEGGDETAETDGAGEGANETPEFNPDDLTSDTQNSFDESMKNDVEDTSEGYDGFNQLDLPRLAYAKDTIIEFDQLKKDRGNWRGKLAEADRINGYDICDYLSSEVPALKKKTNKKVNVLVREFERRKAAYQYARATESDTGVIDPTKLHAYKISDQIFLSKSVLADAKSHGMVFLIDYSGSMGYILADVIEQTINLVEFCKKVGIPFDVYSFTNSFHGRNDNITMTPAINEVGLGHNVVIRQLSSGMKKNDYNEAINHLWSQVALDKRYGTGGRKMIIGHHEHLGGTPLDSTLAMMHSLVKDFIAKHQVQKTMFVTLTDGDSHQLDFNNPGQTTFKRQVKANGKVYDFHRHATTENMVKIVGDIPTVSTIAFFLSGGGTPKRIVQNEFGFSVKDLAKKVKTLNKDGFLLANDHKGYNSYFLLKNNVKIEDEDFSFDSKDTDLATSKRAQTRLAKEFSKHNGDAKKSRVLMSQIAQIVA